MHRNGEAWRTTNNRTTCIRMGALCYRVYYAEMVAIELLYTHEKSLTNGDISFFLFITISYFLLLYSYSILFFTITITIQYYYSIIIVLLYILLL